MEGLDCDLATSHTDLEKENQIKQTHIKFLEGRIRLLQSDQHQLLLFNEAEAQIDSTVPEDPEINVCAHTRKKQGRKPLPKDLPRIDVIHDLTDEEKECGCGSEMSRCGEEVTEKLDIVPAKMEVIRHIRYKYACKHCEGVDSDGPTVTIAPAPVQFIPKGIATPGLAAHILTAKFEDALPY